MKRVSDFAKEPVLDIVELYLSSTFCLQPMGDSVSRKATIDSLLLGCIPVLFHARQAVQWPWHWGGWLKRATVLLNFQEVISGARIDPIARLKSISQARVASMQRTIAEHAHCLHYADRSGAEPKAGALSSAPDAFSIALQGSWELAQSGEAWRLLKPNLLPKQRKSRQELCPPIPMQ